MRSRSTPTPGLPVYQQIAGAIEHQVELGRYAPGDRIPSIRELCEQFGVGDVTIKRALRRLQQRGVIRAVVGSGSYVAPRAARGSDVRTALGAAVVMLGPPPRAVFQHEVNLIQRALQRRGHPMLYCAVESDAQLPDTFAHLRAASTGCLIVFPRHGAHPLPPPGADLLNDRGMPVLVLESPDPDRAHVTADLENASALIVDHLYRLGHRRLWLTTRYQRKINGFRDAAARWADPTLDTNIVPASCDSLREMRQVAEQIVRARPRPTAVIACNDAMAELFIEHFADVDLCVPTDISVAAYDDYPNFATGANPHVAITTVRHPADEIAEEVAHWAHDRLSGKPQDAPLRRSITGSLIVRDSTAPPPQD